MKFIGKKMTEAQYREHPSLSRSELWQINESPEKFKYYMTTPEPPTESLLFGSVFHKLVLEPEDFENEYAVEINVDKRTKDGREQYQEWLGTVANKTVVPAKMYTKALEMAQVINNSRLAKALLEGEKEHAYFWSDDFTQVDCKCRIDCLKQLKDKLVIVDLKTASSCRTDKWIKDAIKFGYDVQSAMYSEGIKANYGVTPEFVFVVQEKDAPYSINIFKATPEFTDYGYDRFRSLIGLYKHCVDTNDWYGYMGEGEQINDLTLPSWLGGSDE